VTKKAAITQMPVEGKSQHIEGDTVVTEHGTSITSAKSHVARIEERERYLKGTVSSEPVIQSHPGKFPTPPEPEPPEELQSTWIPTYTERDEWVDPITKKPTGVFDTRKKLRAAQSKRHEHIPGYETEEELQYLSGGHFVSKDPAVNSVPHPVHRTKGAKIKPMTKRERAKYEKDLQNNTPSPFKGDKIHGVMWPERRNSTMPSRNMSGLIAVDEGDHFVYFKRAVDPTHAKKIKESLEKAGVRDYRVFRKQPMNRIRNPLLSVPYQCPCRAKRKMHDGIRPIRIGFELPSTPIPGISPVGRGKSTAPRRKPRKPSTRRKPR
jgi:hypothetical protein